MNQTEKIDILAQEMIRFNRNDPKRIQHLMSVHRFAQLIGRMEQLDKHNSFWSNVQRWFVILVFDQLRKNMELAVENCKNKKDRYMLEECLKKWKLIKMI